MNHRKESLEINENSRILTYSQRKLRMHAAWACFYEFQDLIGEIDDVDQFVPSQNYDVSKQIFSWVKKFSRSCALGDAVRPKPNSVYLERDYDLFYILLEGPGECFVIDSIRNWRERSKFAICHILEIWEKDIPRWEPLLKHFYKNFDHIFVGHYHGLDKISQITGCPCSYLPVTVDALKFCPEPVDQPRPIDVLSLGRNSNLTHKVMYEFAEREGLWYIYDTLKNFEIKDYREHRALVSNQIKRSRYFFAHQSRANQPEVRGNQSEFGYRFFEGAAAGAVMIGDYPDTDVYRRYFNWPDATIKTPFDDPNIEELIRELDSQPKRISKIRENNVVNMLLRYDHALTWEKVLATAGLTPTKKLLDRKKNLEHTASLIKAGSS
ncbi:MAG: glycosyltransferase [Elainellaceae cyanobacterium]